jgi:dolichol-phosphate mannosyltransferase
MLASIVVSFRNEQENIKPLVTRIDATFKDIPDVGYEIVFVDDDSVDDSIEILKSLQHEYPIRIVRMARRFGVIPCIIAGLEHSRGDCAINIEADLQDPPELIGEMIAKWRAGAEVVHTTRTHRDGENALKMWVTRLAYRTINYFSDTKLPENTGNYKLLSRRAIDILLALPEKDPYFRGMTVWMGLRQDFVYFRRAPRFAGETQRGLMSGAPAREFLRGLTAFSAKPLFFAFFVGLAACVFAVALIIYSLAAKLMGLSAPGAAGTLIAISFFSGLIMMTNGVIGLYIAKIYNEVKARPRYIVDDVSDYDDRRAQRNRAPE